MIAMGVAADSSRNVKNEIGLHQQPKTSLWPRKQLSGGRKMKTVFSVSIVLFFTFGCSSNTTSSSGNNPFDFGLQDGPSKKMFLTQTKYNGALGGVSGADAKCNSDPAKPGAGTYKAFIRAGTHRRACTSNHCESGKQSEHINWVLQPNTYYTRPDGTWVFKTYPDRGVFQIYFNRLVTNDTNDAREFWSGMDYDWNHAANDPSLDTCDDWTTSLSGGSKKGLIGDAYADTEGYFANRTSPMDRNCNQLLRLLCIEQ
ncbi:MAG: DUF1554 domain-containing protein [Turneriella sp.]|nr:DUF1554 domain-containing protein [Turneriella sp.]